MNHLPKDSSNQTSSSSSPYFSLDNRPSSLPCSAIPAWENCTLFFRFLTSQRLCEWKLDKNIRLFSSSSRQDRGNTTIGSGDRCGNASHNITLQYCPAIMATLAAVPKSGGGGGGVVVAVVPSSGEGQQQQQQVVEEEEEEEGDKQEGGGEGEGGGGLTRAAVRDLLDEWERTQPRGCWRVTRDLACECEYVLLLRYKKIAVYVTRMDDPATKGTKLPIL